MPDSNKETQLLPRRNTVLESFINNIHDRYALLGPYRGLSVISLLGNTQVRSIQAGFPMGSPNQHSV